MPERIKSDPGQESVWDYLRLPLLEDFILDDLKN